jgi:hypothetical protein
MSSHLRAVTLVCRRRVDKADIVPKYRVTTLQH